MAKVIHLRLSGPAEDLAKELNKVNGLTDRDIIAKAFGLLGMAQRGELAEKKTGRLIKIPKFKMGDDNRKDEKPLTYLFSWDDIPGNDNNRLIEFLKQTYDIGWAVEPKIEKIDDDRTIEISAVLSLLLKLNDDKTKVSLKINDGRTDEFIAKNENGKLKIYKFDKCKEVN